MKCLCGYYTHELTVALVTQTRAIQDQANQNSDIDRRDSFQASFINEVKTHLIQLSVRTSTSEYSGTRDQGFSI